MQLSPYSSSPSQEAVLEQADVVLLVRPEQLQELRIPQEPDERQGGLLEHNAPGDDLGAVRDQIFGDLSGG